MIRILTATAAMVILVGTGWIPAFAMAEDDEIVRLPQQGQVRDRETRDKVRADRLKPAGGLFVSFDVDNDGFISPQEVMLGIPLAFAAADANADGTLTALEQQAWAAGLPTRDDTLANPVRFDPNLDRMVDLSEFAGVINNLGADYTDEISGQIIVASLTAGPDEARRRGFNLFDGEISPRGGATIPRN